MTNLFEHRPFKVAAHLLTVLSLVGYTISEATESLPSTVEVAAQSSLSTIDPTKSPAEGVIELVRQSPQTVKKLDSGSLLIDFGKVAFGNVELSPPQGVDGLVVVRFGEKLKGDAIDRKPPGTVRYSEIRVKVTAGKTSIIAPPVDKRNTQQTYKKNRRGNVTPPAVLTPTEWGVITPFRWVEIEGLRGDLDSKHIARRAAFPIRWDDEAASFVCSDETLNRVWELCRYSIKATLYAGVYVDGDRERIPYEADAYLNQLSHYYVDSDRQAARLTFDWLMQYPTWPTEWGPHMVFMAHADWMHTGDRPWLAERYEGLKSKTLIERCGESGFVESNAQQINWNDIIDWPPSERDGYVRTEVNTVVNAFHLAAVNKMTELAKAVGNQQDAERYARHAKKLQAAFNEQLFDNDKGLYRDGLGVDHHSVHANFLPLAFNLTEEKHRPGIANWLAERGMRCSTYASQYLLEGLFESGGDEAAVKLMVAEGDRSWRHMLESDATITWESWNEVVKPNLDWNHAWGAAPANLLPRYVLGVEPLTPGWRRAHIHPRISGLDFARGKVPSPMGPIVVDWNRQSGFQMELTLPEGMSALVQVPNIPKAKGVFVDNVLVEAELNDGYWTLKQDLSGSSVVEVRSDQATGK